MLNKSQKEGLIKIGAGLEQMAEGIRLVIQEEGNETPVRSAKSPLVKEGAKEPVEDVEVKEGVPEKLYSESELKGKSFNDLKTLAKEKGISAKGTKAELIERLTEVVPENIEEGTDEPEVVEEPKKPVASSKKPTRKAKKEADKPVTVEGVSEEEAERIESIRGELAEFSIEELAEALQSCEITATGNKEALVDKAVEAVLSGVLKFEDDEEDTPDESDKEGDTEVVESDVELDEEMQSIINACTTEERKIVISDFLHESLTEFSSGELKREDMLAWYESKNYDSGDLANLETDELFSDYIQSYVKYIDNDGNLVETDSEPYEVNGETFCCGEQLKYVKEKDEYICEVCGETYEAS